MWSWRRSMQRFFASPQQMGQVLMNLINNAVEAITGVSGYFERAHLEQGGGGNITIKTYNRDEEFVIELRDSGPGIPPTDLNRIFDPFFTSKKSLGMESAWPFATESSRITKARSRPPTHPTGGPCSPSPCPCSSRQAVIFRKLFHDAAGGTGPGYPRNGWPHSLQRPSARSHRCSSHRCTAGGPPIAHRHRTAPLPRRAGPPR